MKTLDIALLQTSLIWEDPQKNREMLSRKMEDLSKGKDLVVLPEMFSTGFTMQPGNMAKQEGQATLDWMLEMARYKNVAITGSTVFYDEGHYYNRLFFIEPNGKISKYDKRHTFTLAGEDKVYKAGK